MNGERITYTVIGLKRHTVSVVEYQPHWAELFYAESTLLKQLLGELVTDIQHVGSTSVPGLPAKPILDIAVAMRSRADLPAIIAALTHHGYIDRGDGGSDGGYLLVKDAQPDVRTVHLHIVECTDVQWRDYLAFRNALRSDPAIREEYAALKLRLASRYSTDRKAYTAGKHEFIQGVLKRYSIAGQLQL